MIEQVYSEPLPDAWRSFPWRRYVDPKKVRRAVRAGFEVRLYPPGSMPKNVDAFLSYTLPDSSSELIGAPTVGLVKRDVRQFELFPAEQVTSA